MPVDIQSIMHPDCDVSLRLVSDADFAVFFAIYGDPEVMRHIGRTLDESQARSYLQQTLLVHQDKQPKYLTWVIENVSDGEAVGLVGAHWQQPALRNEVDVGVMILAKWRRQKKAHQAKALLINQLIRQPEIEQVVVRCWVDNLAAMEANAGLGLKKGQRYVDRKTGQLCQQWHTQDPLSLVPKSGTFWC